MIFTETISNQENTIIISVIPLLKTINSNKKRTRLAKSNVKYKYFFDRIEFEFYVEKKIVISSFGAHQIDFFCAQQKKTIFLVRKK